MYVDRPAPLMAGALILISVLLALKVSLNWLWFTAFVGANLLSLSYQLVPGHDHPGENWECPGYPRTARSERVWRPLRGSGLFYGTSPTIFCARTAFARECRPGGSILCLGEAICAIFFLPSIFA